MTLHSQFTPEGEEAQTMKTRNILLATAAILLLSVPAFADNNNSGCQGNCSGSGTPTETETLTNTSNNTNTVDPTIVNAPTNNNTNTQGQGQIQGQAVYNDPHNTVSPTINTTVDPHISSNNTNVAIGGEGGQGGRGGNAYSDANSHSSSNSAAAAFSNSESSVHSSNTNDNRSSATGGNATGGNATGGSSGASASINNERSAATAYAGPLVASTEACQRSTTGGVQALGFGISLGSTYSDPDCQRRMNARLLHDTLGLTDAAESLMCQDADVAKAIHATGAKCPGE